jgi:hypothetical protein
MWRAGKGSLPNDFFSPAGLRLLDRQNCREVVSRCGIFGSGETFNIQHSTLNIQGLPPQSGGPALNV